MMRKTALTAATSAATATAVPLASTDALVLLQHHALHESSVQWDVKAWFDSLRKHNKDEAKDKKLRVKSNEKSNESTSVNETSSACEDWCSEETYKEVKEGVEVVKNISLWSMKCNWVHCHGCSPCDDKFNSTAGDEQHQGVSLMVEDTNGIGHIVPVTEAGYQTVAALQDDQQMRAFIYRVAKSEARYIDDVGSLNGLVPYYSGTATVQTLSALRNDLRNAQWVRETEGRHAPLSEVGYQKVAAMMSKPDMVAFARRILDASHQSPTDEKAFVELVGHYSGTTGRNFQDLQHAVTSAPWLQARALKNTDAVLAEESPAAPAVLAEEAPAAPAVLAEEAPAAPAVHEEVAVAHKGKGAKHNHEEQDIQKHSGLAFAQGSVNLESKADMEATLAEQTFAAVPISEAGYQTTAALQDNKQMKAFIYKVAQSEARYIDDLGALNGLIPYYSGEISVQSLDALRADLRAAPWVLETEGRRAPLTEYGYQKVAAMMSKPDMVAFARRVLDAAHKTPEDEAAFVETASHFNGSTGRNFNDLRHAILTAPWLRSRLTLHTDTEDAVLSEQDASTVAHKGKGGKGLPHDVQAKQEAPAVDEPTHAGKGGKGAPSAM